MSFSNCQLRWLSNLKKAGLITLMLLMSSNAHSLNFDQPILDLNNKPMMEQGEPVTLGKVAATALFANYPDEKNVSGEDKFKRGMLALKVRNGEVTLTVEEVALIKTLIAKGFSPLIVTRAWPMLDANVAPPATNGSGNATTKEKEAN